MRETHTDRERDRERERTSQNNRNKPVRIERGQRDWQGRKLVTICPAG